MERLPINTAVWRAVNPTFKALAPPLMMLRTRIVMALHVLVLMSRAPHALRIIRVTDGSGKPASCGQQVSITSSSGRLHQFRCAGWSIDIGGCCPSALSLSLYAGLIMLHGSCMQWTL